MKLRVKIHSNERQWCFECLWHQSLCDLQKQSTSNASDHANMRSTELLVIVLRISDRHNRYSTSADAISFWILPRALRLSSSTPGFVQRPFQATYSSDLHLYVHIY